MERGHILTLFGTVLLLATAPAPAQQIVSARSGAIHHIQGKAFIDGQELHLEFAKFPNLKPGSALSTGEGLAEMLLTPGVILRLAENSSVKMIANRLTDTQVEFVDGSALIEAMEILKDNAVTVRYRDTAVAIDKAGLYRFDSDPAELRVYKGKARVIRDDQEIVAKGGRLVDLGTYLAATRFDTKNTDSLYRWSSRRSGYLAMANLSAARSLDRWGNSWGVSGWRWNPYFGLMTFVPAYGRYSSPFGYSFWSPESVYYVYAPPRRLNSGGGGFASSRGAFSQRHGYIVTGGRSASTAASTYSGVTSSGGASASSGAVSRGSSSSAGRGGAGGGRGH